MNNRVIAILFILLAGCSSAPITNSKNIYRPTLSDNPVNYLRGFALDTISKDDIFDKIGTPDKTVTSGDREFLTYSISPKQAQGIIEYTYVIKNGKVNDVKYVNSGNFFGVQQHESAREIQK